MEASNIEASRLSGEGFLREQPLPETPVPHERYCLLSAFDGWLSWMSAERGPDSVPLGLVRWTHIAQKLN